jgi:hypothetical protein
MPKQVLGHGPRNFTKLVIEHRECLAGTNRGSAKIAALETDFRHLKTAHADDQALQEAIGSVDEDTTDFDLAWKDQSVAFASNILDRTENTLSIQKALAR